jgi:hypothetical protein
MLSTLAVPILVVWFTWSTTRIKKRARALHARMCGRCGHDLTGLGDSGVCGECGRAFDMGSQRRLWGVKADQEHR